jgi:hypothetical protein
VSRRRRRVRSARGPDGAGWPPRSAGAALPVRPAASLAQEPLHTTRDGEIWLTLRHRWAADGTTHLRFDPLELLERLAVLTPRPRVNLIPLLRRPGPARRLAVRTGFRGASPVSSPPTRSHRGSLTGTRVASRHPGPASISVGRDREGCRCWTPGARAHSRSPLPVRREPPQNRARTAALSALSKGGRVCAGTEDARYANPEKGLNVSSRPGASARHR